MKVISILPELTKVFFKLGCISFGGPAAHIVSSVGLMAAVTLKLTLSTMISWPAWIIALAAAIVSLRWKVNSLWLVMGGAIAGWLLSPWAI